MNLANSISVFRFLLIPFLIYCLVRQFFMISALLVMISAFSDLLDGYIARKWNEVTRLGMLLDPLADKLLVVSLFIFFVSMNELPMWFLLIMVYRDFSLLFGVVALRFYQKQAIVPSQWIGKFSTALNLGLVFLLCVKKIYLFTPLVITALVWISAIAAIWAFVQYSFRWFKLFQGQPV